MDKKTVYTFDDAIDSHQHFWQYDAVKHDWINDKMAVIRKDFLPQDLEPILTANQIAGCIAVQADQTAAETDFLLGLAKSHTFIKGIVGWVDLRADDISDKLEHYFVHSPAIKGFRHVLQGESPEFMLQKSFVNGISNLRPFNFTYDILIYPKHLPAAIALVSKFPDQAFVIDHIAKPYIKDGLIDEWRKDIQTIATYKNVYCKVSGLVTEADFKQWKEQDFTPYLDAVVEAFGIERLMYGSDWPVCLVGGSYGNILDIVKQYFADFSMNEQSMFFGKNAARFYNL